MPSLVPVRRRRSRSISLQLLALAGVLALAARASATTTLTFTSAPGEYVAQGQSGVVTDSTGVWTAGSPATSNFQDVELDFNATAMGATDWTLDFRTPTGGSELGVANYPTADCCADASTAEISICHDGRCCGSSRVGSFNVTAIQYDVYGVPIRFSATFSQKCSAASALLTGTIDYTFDGTVGPAPLKEGNVVAVYKHVLREYTPAGALVRVLPIARPAGGPPATEMSTFVIPARDVTVDGGILHLYNYRDFNTAYLSSFDYAGGTWTHTTCADWDALSGERNGDVAAAGRYVFATDFSVNGNASGIVRFDRENGYACTRYFDGNAYDDLDVGADGVLYALRTTGTIEKYDPASMSSQGTVTPDRTLTGIAVDGAGLIYGATGGSSLYALSAAGTTQTTFASGFPNQFDLTRGPTGSLVSSTSQFGSGDADFVLANAALDTASQVVIVASSSETATFTAFVRSLFSGGFETGDTTGWVAVGGS